MKSEMEKDTKELRSKCKANIWPESLLAKYHPREDYTGSVEQAFTKLMYMSPALHDIIQGFFDRKEKSIDEGLLLFTEYELDLLPREIMSTAIEMKKIRKGYDVPVNLIQKAWLIKQANDGLWSGIRKSVSEKESIKAPRPDWVKNHGYESEYDMPSTWSTAMASAIQRIHVEFDIEGDLIFDTAYLLAMMPAMYGKCYIDSCLHGLFVAGLLSKDYRTQAI